MCVFPRSYNLRCTKPLAFATATGPKMPERQRHESGGGDRDTQRAVSPLRRQSARDDKRDRARDREREKERERERQKGRERERAPGGGEREPPQVGGPSTVASGSVCVTA